MLNSLWRIILSIDCFQTLKQYQHDIPEFPKREQSPEKWVFALLMTLFHIILIVIEWQDTKWKSNSHWDIPWADVMAFVASPYCEMLFLFKLTVLPQHFVVVVCAIYVEKVNPLRRATKTSSLWYLWHIHSCYLSV